MHQLMAMIPVSPFLMFDDRLEPAMGCYTRTFPDSEVPSVARAGPGTAAEFLVGSQRVKAYDGGSS